MSFNADFLTTTTLIKIELPLKTLRICDGGFVVWPAEPDEAGVTSSQTYTSEDDHYGTLFSGQALTDGQGDEAPSASITFLANSNEAAGQITSSDMQWSRVSMWQASVNQDTGLVTHVEGLYFGFIDVPTLRDGSSGRLVDITLVSDTERFFLSNDGNRLSPEAHKENYPGETGLDNMTNVEKDVAWGTDSRPKGSSSGSYSSAPRSF